MGDMILDPSGAIVRAGIPATRTVTAGTGLTGGGDLSADRTLEVDFGAGHDQVMRGDATSGMSNPMTAAGDMIVGGTPVAGVAPPERRTLAQIAAALPVATASAAGTMSAAMEQKLATLSTATGIAALYPDDSTSDVGGYHVLSLTPVSRAEDTDTITVTAGAAPVEVFGDSYVTPLGATSLSVPVGTWTARIWADVSSVASTTCVLRVYVIKRTAGGAETDLFTGAAAGTAPVFTTPALSTTLTRYDLDYTVAAPVTLGATDRIVVKFAGVRTSGSTARDVRWTANGTAHYSSIDTSITGASVLTGSASVAITGGVVSVVEGAMGATLRGTADAAAALALLIPAVQSAGWRNHWRLDEASGSFVDAVGAETLVPSGTWTRQTDGAYLGLRATRAATPTLDDRLVSALGTPVPGAGDIVLAVTTRHVTGTTVYDAGGYAYPLGLYGAGSLQIKLYATGNNLTLYADIGGGGAASSTVSGIDWTLPHRIVVQRPAGSGTTIAVYLDGVSVATCAPAGASSDWPTLCVGGEQGHSGQAAGGCVAWSFNDVCIGTTALDAAGIAADYLQAKRAFRVT